VRYVYPGSPAAEAGIRAEDRLVRLADKPVTDVASAWQTLGNYEPQQKIKLAVERGAETKEFELELAGLADGHPGEPPRSAQSPSRRLLATGRRSRGDYPSCPEETNECLAYVPDNYHPDVAYGIVLWLHETRRVRPQESWWTSGRTSAARTI